MLMAEKHFPWAEKKSIHAESLYGDRNNFYVKALCKTNASKRKPTVFRYIKKYILI